MANNEASFKKEIRDAVKDLYGSRINMWNTTDRFIPGIPDTMITFDGLSIGWEAKFVRNLPARAGSKVLTTHEVTEPQIAFLKRNIQAGGLGFVVVGSPDDALFLPPDLFENGNISKEKLLAAVANPFTMRVQKLKSRWQIEGLLEALVLQRR